MKKSAPLHQNSKNNLEPSSTGNFFSFRSFPGSAGVTTNSFGDWGRQNPNRQQLFERLMDLTSSNYFIKVTSRHQNKLVSINNNCQNYIEADATIYQPVANFSPVIMFSTADCPVVIIADQQGTVVGIIRASWREIEANLIVKVVNQLAVRFGLLPAGLRAWVWPGICPHCLPLSRELKSLFSRNIKNGKLDLKTLIITQLIKAGVSGENIATTSLCSSHSRQGDKNLFYSKKRREDGTQNIVFVKIEP